MRIEFRHGTQWTMTAHEPENFLKLNHLPGLRSFITYDRHWDSYDKQLSQWINIQLSGQTHHHAFPRSQEIDERRSTQVEH